MCHICNAVNANELMYLIGYSVGSVVSHSMYSVCTMEKVYRKTVTCVKWPLKIGKTKILMTTGSLMNVKSIAECSPWCILQFWPALSDNWS